MHPALSNDIFYIVPEKCTECVGFHDHEACAAVCPVDCCVPNPDIPETHEVLLARARTLHPDKTIPDDAPSRFQKEGAARGRPPPRPRPAPARRAGRRASRAGARRRGRDRRASRSPRPTTGRSRSTASAARASTPCPSATSAPASSSTCPHCQGSLRADAQHGARGRGGARAASTRAGASAFEDFHERRRRELEQFEERQRRELERFEDGAAAARDAREGARRAGQRARASSRF